MPYVSVILPAFNSERFIDAAVESVLTQTFTDFELIVIDDGSADSTARRLAEWARRDARVRLISRPNRGLVATLNEAIGLCRADLIARMDADDVCLPDRLARQVRFMDSHPQTVLLGGGYWLTDQHGRRLTRLVPPTDNATLQAHALAGKTPVCHPLAMYRKSAVDQVGGYRESTMLAEDLDLWLRLGEVGEIAALAEPLLEYRQHSGSISETRQAEQQAMIRRVLREAYQRRGVGSDVPDVAPWRSAGDADSNFRQLLKYGWWAWRSGQRSTAGLYGWSAVRRSPLDRRGWVLLASAYLRRPAPRPAERQIA